MGAEGTHMTSVKYVNFPDSKVFGRCDNLETECINLTMNSPMTLVRYK